MQRIALEVHLIKINPILTFNMKKFILPLILLFFICGTISCKDDLDSNDELILIVASEKAIDTRTTYYMPYFVKYHPLDEWHYFLPIEGFEHEKGYEYVVRVWREKWHNGEIMDAGIYRYTLLEVISKIKKNSDGLPD